MSDIVTSNINIRDAVSERADFGLALIAAYHTAWPERTKLYSTAAYDTELVADGFGTDHPVYLAAAALVASNDGGAIPESFKVGRLTGLEQRVIRLTPTVANNTVYSGKINGVAFTYTSDATATIVEILAGVESSIVTGAEPVTTDDTSGTHLDITGDVADEWFTLSELSENWTIEDRTPVPGTDLQTDLAAIFAEDPEWYALEIADARSKAKIVDADAWTSTKTGRVLYVATTHDTAVAEGTAGNVALTLQGTTSETAVFYAYACMGEYPASAWFGRCLPVDAGRQTWAGKTLTGITPETIGSLTTAQRANLESASANWYTRSRSRNFTRHGWSARGRFIDIIRGRDALDDEIEAAVQDAILDGGDGDGLPYTLGGFTVVMGAVGAVLEAFATGDKPFLVFSSLSTSTGDPADASAADKAARSYTLGSWRADAANAIHDAVINGTISS